MEAAKWTKLTQDNFLTKSRVLAASFDENGNMQEFGLGSIKLSDSGDFICISRPTDFHCTHFVNLDSIQKPDRLFEVIVTETRNTIIKVEALDVWDAKKIAENKYATEVFKKEQQIINVEFSVLE
jgi:hypothetical protein